MSVSGPQKGLEAGDGKGGIRFEVVLQTVGDGCFFKHLALCLAGLCLLMACPCSARQRDSGGGDEYQRDLAFQRRGEHGGRRRLWLFQVLDFLFEPGDFVFEFLESAFTEDFLELFISTSEAGENQPCEADV
jgi:hypothetical protein